MEEYLGTSNPVLSTNGKTIHTTIAVGAAVIGGIEQCSGGVCRR